MTDKAMLTIGTQSFELMTGLVVIDAKLPMDEVLEISSADVDTEKHTYSRLAVGSELTRDEMLLLALM
eukprot:gene3654-4992_t